MSGELAPREALTRLGASSAEAIAQALEMFAPGMIERGDVSVLADSGQAFSSLTRGSVSVGVSYVDGVTGANIFVLGPAGARKLAIAMGSPAPDDDAEPLSELELSAVAEAANQMMAAAASAIGVVLGHEVEISPPQTRLIEDPATEGEHYGSSPHTTSTTFLIGGEGCRLIQLIPNAFLVRMTRAFDELGGDIGDDPDASGDGGRTGSASGESVGLTEALTQIHLRVWAELGRTKLPLGRALGLPLGAVVELDQSAEDPIDLFVNGVRFAQGRLIVTDDGEWAFALDEVSGRTAADAPSPDAQPSTPPLTQRSSP